MYACMSINIIANTSHEGTVHKIKTTITEGIKNNIAKMSIFSIIVHSEDTSHTCMWIQSISLTHNVRYVQCESQKVYMFQKVLQVNSYYLFTIRIIWVDKWNYDLNVGISAYLFDALYKSLSKVNWLENYFIL